MKTTVANATKSTLMVCAVLAAAGLIGAAVLPGGPDLTYRPEMAEHAVWMPDGTPLYVQKYEVSVAEWNACNDAGACTLRLRVMGNHTEQEMPATGLSYVDVSEYLQWINDTAGGTYRLPTLSEWEYMAADVMPETPDPIFTDPELTWASAYLMEPQTKRTLRARGSFDTTSEGVVDLNGSVWEWTMDCYAGAAEEQITPDRCPAFFVGGEHVAAMSFLVRDPARGGCAVGTPPAHLGMRLVSDDAPKWFAESSV
jgi:formylglycine-generating enzyme required for sulfatase activity